MERYLYLLAPKVQIRETHPVTKRPMLIQAPIYVRYERIMKIVNANDKYRKKLLGSSLKTESGELYDMINMCSSDKMPNYSEFITLDLHLQTKLTAQFMLSNMVDVVERHDKLQEEAIKKIEDKAKSKRRRGRR